MKRDTGDAVTLELLEAIESKCDVTQRNLADRLDVALGRANAHLGRCVRDGFVKMQQAPSNRYRYYLTPKGCAEKDRLAAQHLTASMQYYHRAGRSIGAALSRCARAGRRRVLLAGMSELAEIALVRMFDFDIVLVGTIDPGAQITRFLDRPVWTTINEADEFDAVIFTALAGSRELLGTLQREIEADRLVIPEIALTLLGSAIHGEKVL